MLKYFESIIFKKPSSYYPLETDPRLLADEFSS